MTGANTFPTHLQATKGGRKRPPRNPHYRVRARRYSGFAHQAFSPADPVPLATVALQSHCPADHWIPGPLSSRTTSPARVR